MAQYIISTSKVSLVLTYQPLILINTIRIRYYFYYYKLHVYLILTIINIVDSLLYF
jgi:hypothetical protein